MLARWRPRDSGVQLSRGEAAGKEAFRLPGVAGSPPPGPGLPALVIEGVGTVPVGAGSSSVGRRLARFTT